MLLSAWTGGRGLPRGAHSSGGFLHTGPRDQRDRRSPPRSPGLGVPGLYPYRLKCPRPSLLITGSGSFPSAEADVHVVYEGPQERKQEPRWAGPATLCTGALS